LLSRTIVEIPNVCTARPIRLFILTPHTHRFNFLSLIINLRYFLSLLTVNLNATVSNRFTWQTLRETETVPPLPITGNQIDYKAAHRRHFKLTVLSIGTLRFHFCRRLLRHRRLHLKQRGRRSSHSSSEGRSQNRRR
jgi:hypothetical protein